VLVVCGSGITATACQSLQGGSASTSGGATAVPEGPVLDLSAESPWPAPYASDPLWRRAENGTDFEQARLAERESAEALVAAVRVGGSLGRTALGALRYASERREIRGQLCDLVPGPAPATLSLLLDALHEVVTDAPVTEDSLARDGDAACADKLLEVSRRAELSPADQDRVQALLAALRAGTVGR
jgi:hypothetical protein